MFDTRFDEELSDLPDVRQYIVELLAQPDPEPGDVPWQVFHVSAEKMTGQLRALYAEDTARAAANLTSLFSSLLHVETVAVAALAVPFLVRAATDPAVHDRTGILRLAAFTGGRRGDRFENRATFLHVVDPPDQLRWDVHGFPEPWTLQASRYALSASTPSLTPLLHDSDAELRIHAAYVLATASDPPPGVTDELRMRLTTETEPAVRISLVLAIAQLSAREDWARRLWTDTNNPADVRFAGALAWLCLTTAPAPAALLDLLDATTDATTARWLREVPWCMDFYSGKDPDLPEWLGTFLDGEPGRAQA